MVSRFLWTLLPFGTLTDNSLDSLRVNKNIILQSSSHSVWPQIATSVLKPVLLVGTEQKFLQFWFVSPTTPLKVSKAYVTLTLDFCKQLEYICLKSSTPRLLNSCICQFTGG
jgi:hypothetical protein